MKTVGVVVALAALALPQAAVAQKPPLTDFPWARPGQRLENVSEEGYRAIVSIASILSGETVVRLKIVPVKPTSQEGIFYAYTQNPCFLFPDEEERGKNRVCRDLIEAKRNAWMIFLIAEADRDRSGFVTTEEATAIHDEVKTALQASQLHIGTPDGLLRLLDYRRVTKATLLARLTSYAALREAALEENLLGMPELPEALLRAAEATIARLDATPSFRADPQRLS
jgi:hypothetical protein